MMGELCAISKICVEDGKRLALFNAICDKLMRNRILKIINSINRVMVNNGSAGFLISAMELMIDDALKTIWRAQQQMN